MIEVQEAKLALHLDGPSEVFFGKKEVFKLKVSNTGTGPAENLHDHADARGHRRQPAGFASHGDFGRGRRARDGSRDDRPRDRHVDHPGSVEGRRRRMPSWPNRVLVRRAAIAVAADGPAMQFVGAAATYRIRICNPGNAPAQNVKLVANLPTGAKYVSSEGGQASGKQVQWTLERLEPGVERVFLVKCSLGLPGDSQVGDQHDRRRRVGRFGGGDDPRRGDGRTAPRREGAARTDSRGRGNHLRGACPQPRHQGGPGRSGDGLFLPGDRADIGRGLPAIASCRVRSRSAPSPRCLPARR